MPKGRMYVKLYRKDLIDFSIAGEPVEKDDEGAFLVPHEHAAFARESYGLKDAPGGPEQVEVAATVLSASELARIKTERDELEAKVKELEGKVAAHEQARGRK